MMSSLRNLTGTRKDLLAILILFGLSAVFFANVLFTDHVLVGDNLARYIPWNSYQDPQGEAAINYEYDTLLAYYPQFLIARQALRAGELPLWNPYYLSGIPFLAATPWLGLFYIPYVLFYIVDPLEAFGQVAFLQLALGGIFMYLYLRSIDCDRLASLVGAVSFELGGFLLANLTWLPRVSTVIWTPLILLSFEKVIGKKIWVYAILGAFAIAMCILAGNMAAVIYVLLASALYCVFRLLLVLRDEGREVAVRCGLVILVSVSVGVLLSAVQLVPTYEVSEFASRVQVSYDERIESGRSALALGTMLVPDLFGNPVDRPWGRNEFAKNIPGTYGETSLYVGILPLFLAFWALIHRRDAHVGFFAGLAALSICVFLDTPLFRVLYHLPVFRIGRQLEARVMWALAVSVLTALGFRSLAESAQGERRSLRRAGAALLILVLVVICVLVVVALLVSTGGFGGAEGVATEWYSYNTSNLLRLALLLLGTAILVLLYAKHSANAALLGLLALGLIVADLAYFGWKLNPTRRAEGLYPEMKSVAFLQADDVVYRTIRGPLSRKVFPPNSLAVYGISDVQGYSPLLVDYYVDFVNLVEDNISSSRRVYSLRYADSLSSKLLDLLNAKYIITITDPGEEMVRLERADENIELVYDDEVKIYENKNVLPRAFVVTDYRVLQDEGEILAELANEGFDPTALVILEEEPDPRSARADMPGEESSARILEYTANRVTVEVEMSSDGFLVLSDLYYNGWKAYEGGEERKVYRADYCFRAVQLNRGKHVVEFVFDPLSFKVGLLVSFVALFVFAPVAGWILYSKM